MTEELNSQQLEAVDKSNVPVLVLSGAGSGKTKTLTHRIAKLIKLGTNPEAILAVTFTNKAANEMKERIEGLSESTEGIWMGTFHSICVKILKAHGHKIGLHRSFVIADSSDSKRLISKITKTLGINHKPQDINRRISQYKTNLLVPDEVSMVAKTDLDRDATLVYEKYQEALEKSRMLDFDDLIMKTVQLLKTNKETRDYYHDKFKHVLIDEYQDINYSQSELVKSIKGNDCSLFAVGDDAQSIFQFRGADVGQILKFDKDFHGAETIKLEQNYRCTQNILNAANAVIKNNTSQYEKELWTNNDNGDKIVVNEVLDPSEEICYVSRRIRQMIVEGYNLKDMAILYRTNLQSAIIEKQLSFERLPYKVLKGFSFYDRLEIKDIIAYMQVAYNPHNSIALGRIINVPKRKIGAATIDKLEAFAEKNNISVYDSLTRDTGLNASTVKKLTKFKELIDELKANIENPVRDLINIILNKTNYIAHLEDNDGNNIQTLRDIAEEYDNLEDFLDMIALLRDTDVDKDDNKISLLTIHTAKGLEFTNVFVVGMEEGLFPHTSNPEEEEEERRLCYVAITRAKENLTLTSCRTRKVYGRTNKQIPSRFLAEIPTKYTRRDY